MDATVTLFGSVLATLGVLGAAVVAYLGKRGENALMGFSNLTEKLQIERDRLERQVAERDAKLAELNALHAHDQSEIARLLMDNQRLGGTP
ncbi:MULTISPECIES: hypothetical protein [Streptomyces]|uniref:Uncharacterized protein n=1 Tax=Streptomyces venezuelae TaxID=54571 RepID=A0A5P2BAU5_STRVZ|nr:MULTISPECIES: hypothetical protein [Streptomyces]NDZ99764.1 hypothetical protein [Streptomyces sp. SID10116]MYY80680.1 hypothetical protein [Streptomyces sp. SID335]MYZ11817.1 hypothetical protein [Streptomyces sp. SID337]NDZ91079.1 hypothetical protein [Streptomyces sp. SID10115]NEB48237.1 hypothetical protein [Streptomyces sp. SID339]